MNFENKIVTNPLALMEQTSILEKCSAKENYLNLRIGLGDKFFLLALKNSVKSREEREEERERDKIERERE